MAAKFEYDESGGTSLYFLVSFYALVLIPLTYYLWPSKEKKEDPEKLKKQCHCDPCEEKKAKLKTVTAGKTFKTTLKWIGLVVAWIIFIFIVIKASQVERDHIEYDPFEILEIDRGATSAEIRRQYRKLSLLFHPDKETGDPDRFMKIAKAYAALTDEDSKKNWEEYGNPDGPQATTFGIALPAWIVDQDNSVWVLAAYVLAFIVILPVVVGTWWYRSIKYSAVEILLDTTQLYMHYIYKTPCMNLKRAMMILSGSFEFEKSHNNEVVQRPSDNEELPPLVKEFSSEIGLKNKERPFCFPYSLKARTLMHAHLARSELPLDTLEQDKLYILRKCPSLIHEMVNTATQLIAWYSYNKNRPGGAGPNKSPRLDTVEHIMKICPMLVQATVEKTPLLQLPHLDDEVVRVCNSKRRNIKSIFQFAKLKDSDRRHILRHLHEAQYRDVLNVCESLPVLETCIDLKVIDDDDHATLTAGALVTATITIKRDTLKVNLEDDPNTNPNHRVEEVTEVIDQENKQNESPSAQKKKTTHVWEKQKKKKGKGANNFMGGGGQQTNKQKLNKKKKAAKLKEAAAAVEKKKTEEGEEEAKEGGEDSQETALQRVEDVDNSDKDSGEESGAEEEATKDSDSDAGNSSAGEGSDEDDKWDELQADLPRKEKVLEGLSKESHEVHCPHFPDVKQEWWWVYIADRRAMRLITLPQMVYDLKDKKEIQLQFPAPSRGSYVYYLCVKSDSYLDLDHVKPFKFDVQEAKKVEESHPQWDISDEEDRDEEDSAVSDTDDDVSDSESDEE